MVNREQRRATKDHAKTPAGIKGAIHLILNEDGMVRIGTEGSLTFAESMGMVSQFHNNVIVAEIEALKSNVNLLRENILG